MSRPTTVNYDIATGELTEREMTAAEYKEYQAECAKIDAIKAEIDAKAQAKAEVLARLGITAEEAQSLLS